jgi:hypothetical protein
VLVDREETRDDWHARLGGATLAESALTLEELYLALVDNDNATAARVAESLT